MMDHDETALPHVRQQDPDDSKRQVQVGGKVGDRGRQAAPAQDHHVLRLEAHRVGRQAANGGDQRDQVDGLADRPGPAAGQRVRADHGPRIVVQPPVI
jgi:hypothetical protein